MFLIHSIVKGRKIDVDARLHQEITDCATRQTGILVFLSLVMLLCQQKWIVPCDDEEALESKGLINEASIERMTRGKDALAMKAVETSKTKKGKMKAETMGKNLTTDTSLLRKMQYIDKLANSISNKYIRLVATIKDRSRSQNLFYAYTRVYNNSIVVVLSQLSRTPLPEFPVFPPIIREYEPSSEEDDLGDQDRSVECPLIVHVFNVEKGEDSRDVEEYMRRIDSLVKENTEKEAAKTKSVENIINAFEFVGTTTNNLERDKARSVEATEVTSEKHHYSLAIVVYTRPLKVTPPIQEAADDAGAMPETKE
ncbi:hypothetical protein PVK06_040086 [Gossypium arboreum]|uniref:Uncharacterized protein n=1 Tax=Gossypium arboreum TaxID=29729 RepID=A0ABR0N4J1_GOSAR|nr:hypothetical protein PVK06_040086 [Gossypium arboreum]